MKTNEIINAKLYDNTTSKTILKYNKNYGYVLKTKNGTRWAKTKKELYNFKLKTINK